ncbi:MAG TPA: outer membrane beta-barrel protein [Xanthomonadales bacterium]|nr:outer membrane beta-barrel protein [Xanthomonadales bacterium]
MPLKPTSMRATLRSLVFACLINCCTLGNAWAQQASLTLYVFDRGTPVSGIEILIDGELQTLTNPQGVAELHIPAGLHYLELRLQDSVVLDQQILAVQDELAQWIVDVSGGGSAIYDVESSGDQLPVELAGQAAAVTDTAPGTLSGQLLSADDGQPVAGARIYISGVNADIRTDDEGRFELQVPSGKRSLSVLHAAFNTLSRDDVMIEADQTTTLQLQLTPAGSELPEFVVVVPHISGSLASVLEERKEDIVVGNILAAEQISKAGDSDAASALKRVTGLTLVGGRFIYVRGLGERYSSTLLNGANVPSPDPVRRVVPLDLFPSGIIESIAVQKGYTADLPAEFGGGTVLLRTKTLPEEGFFEAELDIGYRDGTTGKEGLRYKGGDSDWTGYDDGARAVPELLREAGSDGTRITEFNRFTGEGFTKAELEAIGESLPVNYDIDQKDIAPNWGFKFSGGDRYDLGDTVDIGFLAALDYGDDWLTTTQQRTDYIVSGGELVSENDFTRVATVREIGLSGFFTLGAEIGDHHRLAYNWMTLRQTTDRTQREQGFNIDADGGDVQFSLLEWVERQLVSNQLLGEHVIPQTWDTQVNWGFTKATADADEPATRSYRYDPNTFTASEDDLIFSLRNDSNQWRWSELEDNSDNWSLAVNQPLKFWKRLDFKLQAGLDSVSKERESDVRRFAFQSKGSLSGNPALRENLNPENIIFANTIDPLGWQINEITIATDAYTADQDIDAWFLAADFFWDEWLRINGGVRQEKSNQSVTTFDIFDPGRNPVISNLDTDDLFPSFSTTLVFGEHQVRAGYGETTNRPDFKELSPSLFKDPILDRQVIGNPNLQPAYIENFDLRWDWYFDGNNFVSLGGFYKEFTNPIETVILAGASQITTFDNAEAAENLGVELELYSDLGFIGRWWGEREFWERFYVNTNYSWIESEITLSEENAAVQTSNSRPLQGQSPYVWNFQIGYDDLDRGINTALLYNIFGERIVDVGTNGAPDIYEQPRPQLDFIYTQGLWENWKVQFKAKNLLDPDVEITQGPETRIRFAVGREYSLSLEFNY